MAMSRLAPELRMYQTKRRTQRTRPSPQEHLMIILALMFFTGCALCVADALDYLIVDQR
jgi:hypothetical protein